MKGLPLICLLAAASLNLQAAPDACPAPTATPQASPEKTAAPTPLPPPTDAQVKARASALEVAGAFFNDGFKTRDSHIFLALNHKEPKFVQVNLFSGNQYWFVAAGAAPAKKLAVSVFDEKGKPVPTEFYENNAQAAAGFAPQVSGPYIIRVQELEGDPASVCLLYSYK